jgi:7-cyano-7-deazaguanine tRNA-ribosyltransferase
MPLRSSRGRESKQWIVAHDTAVLIVAGLSIKNLQPRVWDPESEYYLPDLRAVMVSYGELHRMPRQREVAMKKGLRAYLGVPDVALIYLDNGAFSLLNSDEEQSLEDYDAFVREAQPDWYPIPRDYIPVPSMTREEREDAYRRTMKVNRAYEQDGYVSVVHIGDYLETYSRAITSNERLAQKRAIALGGIVPNLLRASKAIPYADVLAGLQCTRSTFADKALHVFGIGGTATLHVAALLRLDSVDSTGWRNRAARGIIQLPGCGDRTVANLGNWRGRELSADEIDLLRACSCPACSRYHMEGLRAGGTAGFCNRASHNLWVLLEEARLIQDHLAEGNYVDWYGSHLDNTIYRPLIDQLVLPTTV